MAGTSKSKTAAALGSAKPVSNPLARIQTLETACTSSTYDPNPLIPLLALSRHASPEVVHKAIWALHRVFVRYVNEGRVGGIVDGLVVRGARESGEDGLGAGEVKGWVRDRLLEYIEILGGLLRDSESALRVSQLDTSEAACLWELEVCRLMLWCRIRLYHSSTLCSLRYLRPFPRQKNLLCIHPTFDWFFDIYYLLYLHCVGQNLPLKHLRRQACLENGR